MKIMLDAGHGYHTPGKRSPDGLHEYEFTRAVANHAKRLLEKNDQNLTVYFAHSDNRDVPLKERTDRANQLSVDLYISIHANAYGSNWNAANGMETYVHLNKPKEAYQLAQKIQRNLVMATGLRDRGVKTADFHVLRETKMTAVLTECGFMTNPEEAALLRSETYRKACAEAIVNALVDQYGLQIKKAANAQSLSSQTNKGLYKVQVGAFRDQKNAEELANALVKLGYSPFIHFE